MASLLQPRSVPSEVLQHLMADEAGCKPHTEVKRGSVPGQSNKGTTDEDVFYVEGVVMLQGNMDRWGLMSRAIWTLQIVRK